jgi:signal transduction histidine kinase
VAGWRTVTKVPLLDPEQDSALGFATEQRRLILQRVRWVTLIALLPIGVSAVVNALVFTDRLGEHLATLGLQGAMCAAAAAATFHRAAERHAVPLALALVLGVMTVEFWAVSLAAGDVEVLLGALIAAMMGTAFIFPWGVRAQLLVSTHIAAGYLVLVHWTVLDAARITNLLLVAVTGTVLSMTGALVLDRQRRATFAERERVSALARQRELLLDVGRQLNATIDLGELVTLITRLGQRVLDCDVATLTLRDDEGRRWRTVAVSRGRETPAHLDWPMEGKRAFRDALLRQGVIEIPGGTAFDELQQLGTRYGVARMLVVAIQRDGELLGILAFNQRAAAPPFGEQRVRLAEGIAHQAAIALANARLVEDLQRANRVKSDFVSTVSHELRTPLHVILGFAEIGFDRSAGDSAQAECFTKIHTAGRDLLELIESTLAIGKLDAGRDEVQLESVALPDLWARAAAMCERLPRRPAVALEWQPAVPPAALRTDPRKLTVVLRNLVENALKFTERGVVRAAVRVDGARLVVAVTDTGIGIRPEDQAKIFEMFQQADGSDSRRFGGTGLGLYIVQRYVEQLGGTVGVDSTPGRGSTFTVSVPARIADQGSRDAA